MAANFEIEGMKELLASVEKLGSVPKKHATAAVRQGANVILKAARSLAPKKSGALSKGLTVKAERSKTKSKSVFDVVPKTEKALAKLKKKTSFVRQSGDKRYYYPASMEYGFRGKNSDAKVFQGVHYLLKAADNNAAKAQDTIIKVMTEKIDAAWQNRG